jgi:hypothetical protein
VVAEKSRIFVRLRSAHRQLTGHCISVRTKRIVLRQCCVCRTVTLKNHFQGRQWRQGRSTVETQPGMYESNVVLQCNSNANGTILISIDTTRSVHKRCTVGARSCMCESDTVSLSNSNETT